MEFRWWSHIRFDALTIEEHQRSSNHNFQHREIIIIIYIHGSSDTLQGLVSRKDNAYTIFDADVRGSNSKRIFTPSCEFNMNNTIGRDTFHFRPRLFSQKKKKRAFALTTVNSIRIKSIRIRLSRIIFLFFFVTHSAPGHSVAQ